MSNEFEIGDRVKWINGMGIEVHGKVIDCITEDNIKVETTREHRLLYVNRKILNREN